MSIVQCQAPKCRNSMGGGNADSNARALGWMVWEGRTLTGKESRVSFCPVHAGRTEEAAEAQETGYDAECFTCNERASEEPDFEGTEAAAEGWMEEHACEPDVSLIRPKVKAGAS